MDQGAGDGHPLHLPAGEMARPVIRPVTQADPLQQGAGTPIGAGLVLFQQPERQGDVLSQGQMRQQVKGLEYEAKVPPPQPRELILVQGRQFPVPQLDPSAIDGLQARDAVKKGRFPNP